jgi:streptomycin 6-kinase
VADWGEGFARMRERFGGTAGPLPQRLTDEAEQLFADMLNSMDEHVVLHGDLHHFNILAAERQPWLAIDPKGVVGEPAYETGALLRNPWPELLSRPNPERVLARRVGQLADELGLDRRRILAWGIGQAVLSAWWSVEDHGDDSWKSAIEFAEMLASIKV